MTESKLQHACVKWWRYWAAASGINYRFLIAIPNEGKRTIKTGQRMKAEGMVGGASDLILFDPYGKKLPLFIEMKLPKTKQTESQVQFERVYCDSGYDYTVCRNFLEFEKCVTDYLEMGKI